MIVRCCPGLLFAALACCLLVGCTQHNPLPPNFLPAKDIELTRTPFFSQQLHQCGPAALATALGAAGFPVSPEALASEVYLPGRHGSLQVEMIAAIRHHNRIPYQITPTLAAITAELQAGHPVLILQNLGLKSLPVYHYAVVIGIRTDGKIVLRSGTTRRLVMEIDNFLGTWQRAGSWGIVVLRPDEPSADFDPDRYLKAVAALETTGNLRLAEEGYRTCLKRFPNQPVALFGLANTLCSQQRFFEAIQVYRRLLTLHPAMAEAVNNLAEALAALHCYHQALEVLDCFATTSGPASALPAFIIATKKEISRKMDSTQHRDNRECQSITSSPQ
jgi:hypothetical protein